MTTYKGSDTRRTPQNPVWRRTWHGSYHLSINLYLFRRNLEDKIL